MISEKQKEFEKEYQNLLNKYGVKLVVKLFTDEWGLHSSIIFESYINNDIKFQPDYKKIDSGYCGMGG